MPTRFIYPLALALLLFAQATAAAGVPPVHDSGRPDIHVRRFYGLAYGRHSGKYLYTAVHKRIVRQLPDGRRRWLGGSMTYYAPDGSKIGEKKLNFSADPYIPIYRLQLSRPWYVEGISRITPKKIYMYRQKAGQASAKHASVPHAHPMAADSGFDSFIRAHFKPLMNHESMQVTFGLAGKLDSYKFSIHRISDTRLRGHKAVRFKIELASLLRFFAGSITVAYDPRNRRMLEYDGISDLYNPKTGNPYQVRIEYYSKPPANVPAKLPPLNP